MATEKQITDAITYLLAGLSKSKLDPKNVRAYVEDLADIPGEALRQAAVKLRKTEEWMPSIARWRETALQIQEKLDQVRVEENRREKDGQLQDELTQCTPQQAAENRARVNQLLQSLRQERGWN